MSAHHEVVTPALVLRSVDYGDADKVITLLTRELGKVSAFARGVRKSTRRFRGGLGMLQPLEVVFAPRAEGLGALRGSEAVIDCSAIGADLFRVAAGSLVLELIDLTVAEGQGGGDLYLRCEAFVRWLAIENRGVAWLDAGIQRMQLLLMDHAGLLPDISSSARDGRPVAAFERPFWLRDGGIIDGAERRLGEPGYQMTRAALEQLERTLHGRFAVNDPEAADEVRNLLEHIWRWTLDRDPRSAELFRTAWSAAQRSSSG